MQMTAPMKNEISKTIPILSTPKADISCTYFFMNMRIRSGRENVRPISRRYFPNVYRCFCMNMGAKLFCAYGVISIFQRNSRQSLRALGKG